MGLFLNRLKVIPLIQDMKAYGESTGNPLLSEEECNYIWSKSILDDIIGSASVNPVLYLNSIQVYFHVDIEPEFVRRCRQDKFLFLSQLTSQPMVLGNLQQVNLHSSSYFSVKEFAYLMLANQIYKQHMQAAVEKQSNQSGANKLIRNNVFR